MYRFIVPTLTAAVASSALVFPAAASERVRLATDEVIEVEVVSVSDDLVRFTHPVLGEVKVARDEIGLLDRSCDAGVALAAMAEEDAAAAEPEWKSKFVLGGGYTTGNTDTRSLNAQVVSVREAELMKTTLDAGYFYAESDGARSENRFTAGVLNDWEIADSDWFYFAKGRFDFDSYQSWDYRAGAYGGVGYHWIKKDDYTCNLRAGIGAIKEWGSTNDDIRPELLFGADGEWKITEKQSLVYDTTIYPDLKDTGEFRAVSNLGWSVLMDEEAAMSLTAGLQHEYQSQVDAGRDRNDLRIFVGLQFDF